MVLTRRRFFLSAAASLLAAPSIVRAGSLMAVKVQPEFIQTSYFAIFDGSLTEEMLQRYIDDLKHRGSMTISIRPTQTWVHPDDVQAWYLSYPIAPSIGETAVLHPV